MKGKIKANKKIVIIVVTILSLCFMVSDVAKAQTDVESSVYGFNVDLDLYNDVKWRDLGYIAVRADGNIIGICSISIGMTRAKSKSSDGKYMDHVFVLCTMKGKKAKQLYDGYSESLTVKSNLSKSDTLMAFSPATTTSGESYAIGADASTDYSAGVSASVSFERNELVVRNKSDKTIPMFEAFYDYQQPMSRFSSVAYSYDSSNQRAHWVTKTKQSKYPVYINITAKFERWNDEPGFWATAYGLYYTNGISLCYRSQY